MAARAPACRRSTGPSSDPDPDGLRAGADTPRLGFDGKWAIHPAQVPVLNETFTPSRGRSSGPTRSSLHSRARARRRGAWRSTGRWSTRRAASWRSRCWRAPRPRGCGDDRLGAGLGARVGWAAPGSRTSTTAQSFEDAPGLTLTAGHAALHQAVAGDRLRLALDAQLSAAVTGRDAPVRPSQPRLRRRDRPVDAAHAAGARQPLLSRAGAGAAGVPRRDLAHSNRGGGAQAEPAPGGRTGHGTGRAADSDDRLGRRAGARLLALPDDPAARPRRRHGTRRRLRGHPPSPLDPGAVEQALPAGWNLDALREATSGPHHADLEAGRLVAFEARRDGHRRRRSSRGSRSTWPWRTPTPRAAPTGAGSCTGATRSPMAAAHATARDPARSRRSWPGRAATTSAPVFEGDVLRTELYVDGTSPLESGGGHGSASRPRPVRDGTRASRRPCSTGDSWPSWLR